MQQAETEPADGSTFGTVIRRYREAKGLSLRGLARTINVSPTYLSRVENDKTPPPANPRIETLAKALGLDRNVLYGLANRVQPEFIIWILDNPKRNAHIVRTVSTMDPGRQAQLFAYLEQHPGTDRLDAVNRFASRDCNLPAKETAAHTTRATYLVTIAHDQLDSASRALAETGIDLAPDKTIITVPGDRLFYGFATGDNGQNILDRLDDYARACADMDDPRPTFSCTYGSLNNEQRADLFEFLHHVVWNNKGSVDDIEPELHHDFARLRPELFTPPTTTT